METARSDDNDNLAITSMMDTPALEDSPNAYDLADVQTIDERASNEFSDPWNFSDVVLVVGGTKFHVHRCILSIWSPVFKAMFMSQFMESTAKEIPLPGKRADEVLQLLRVIYFDDAKQKVTEANYEFLLKLADEYQMNRVLELCGQYMKQGIDDRNCLHRFKIAGRYGLENVMEKCNEEARFKSSAALEESDDFLELSFESKFKLCMARTKELEEVLTKYIDICSELVNEYYEALTVRMPIHEIYECDNKSAHSLTPFSYGERREFDSSCEFCRKRIERHKGDIEIDALHFDDLFIKLYDLEHDDKVGTLRKNMTNNPAIAVIARRIRFK